MQLQQEAEAEQQQGGICKPICYESEVVWMKYKKYFQQYNMRDARYSWAFLKAFNLNLSEAIQFINMDVGDYYFDCTALHLALSNYISYYRMLWMNPVKVELSQKILQKTSLPRDSAPKVQIERLKIARNNDEREKLQDSYFVP